jgi:hypothetical protein
MLTRIEDIFQTVDGTYTDLNRKDDKVPTSNEEAGSIVRIMNDFLSPDDAKTITRRLDEEVGQKSDNDSLKVSLGMLRALYEDR